MRGEGKINAPVVVSAWDFPPTVVPPAQLSLFGMQCWGCAVSSLARGAARQAEGWRRRVAKVSGILGQILQGRSMETVWDKPRFVTPRKQRRFLRIIRRSIHLLIFNIRITGGQRCATLNIEVTGRYCKIERFIFSACCARDVAERSTAGALPLSYGNLFMESRTRKVWWPGGMSIMCAADSALNGTGTAEGLSAFISHQKIPAGKSLDGEVGFLDTG